MKTLKQIADELRIDKQTVYRFIKKHHINESDQKNGVMYYDDAVVYIVKSGLIKKTTSNEAHQTTSNEAVSEALISMLHHELEIKNNQIEQLQSELVTERRHNREKDVQLLETLSKLAESQISITAGQTADKQKALVESVVEGKKIINSELTDQSFGYKKKRRFFNIFRFKSPEYEDKI